MTTVQFTEVGREKKSWVKTFHKPIDVDDIAREAKANAGLLSRDVDAELTSETKGLIIVGGWRPVGGFEVILST
jgi:hypothetical protein